MKMFFSLSYVNGRLKKKWETKKSAGLRWCFAFEIFHWKQNSKENLSYHSFLADGHGWDLQKQLLLTLLYLLTYLTLLIAYNKESV